MYAIQILCKYYNRKHQNLVKSGLRFNLRVFILWNFLLGGMPPDPLEGLYFALRKGQYTYVMAMQFQKILIKIDFDWPFCPSNNFQLQYIVHWMHGSIMLKMACIKSS